MPTYEYECGRCSHRFEVVQSIKAEPLKRCPVCKGKVKRLMGTGVGIIFKGSGFYQTDYRSDSYKKAQKSDTSSAETAKPAGESKSKSADKPADKPAGSGGKAD